MATTVFCRDMPSHLGWAYHLFFNRTMTQHTSRLCKDNFTKKEREECCNRWPGLHNHPTSTKLRWFGMSRTAEWRKSSQQVLSICGNSSCWKAFQVKLVERTPIVCKAVIKAKGGYLKNLKNKIYLVLFKTFLVTTWFYMCYFIVLMLSLLFYNVENSKNNKKLEWVGVLKLLTGSVYQRIGQGNSCRPHPTRNWSQMSTVCWVSGDSVTNHTALSSAGHLDPASTWKMLMCEGYR